MSEQDATTTEPELTADELNAAQELATLVTQDEHPKPAPPPRRSLEELLGGLDDNSQQAIMREVRTARNEAKNLRDRMSIAGEEAGARAKEELAQTIGKALGLVKDEPVDPAQLTEQLTKAQGEQRQAALELAIFKSTSDAAVANALLDSRSFLAKVADIDPSDTEAITAAVGEAVQSNPALGKRVPAPNPAQGSSGSGPAAPGQLTRDDILRMSPEDIEKARKDGRLNAVLGIQS